MDRNRLPDGASHLRAAVSATESRVPGSAGGKRHVHPRPAGDYLHQKRYGGFARAVGLRAMTTPHGLGYVKMVIMVDEDVDPFNLPQVMWALSSKVNPAGDLVQLPNMSRAGTRPRLKPGGSPTS